MSESYSYLLGFILVFCVKAYQASHDTHQPLPPDCKPSESVENLNKFNWTWTLPPDTAYKGNGEQECKVPRLNHPRTLDQGYGISFRLKAASSCNFHQETNWTEIPSPPSLQEALDPPSILKSSVDNLCIFRWEWRPPSNNFCDVKYDSSLKYGNSEEWRHRKLSHYPHREEQLDRNKEMFFRVKAVQNCCFHQKSDWVELYLLPSPETSLPHCSPDVLLEHLCSSDWTEKFTAGTDNRLSCSLRYESQLKNNDTVEWQYFTSELHKLLTVSHKHGISFRVRAVWDCNFQQESIWTETHYSPPSGEPSVGNLECINYSEEYMNCTWEAGKNASLNMDYNLNYWYKGLDNITLCEHPIYTKGVVTGCHFLKTEIDVMDDICIDVFGKSKLGEISHSYKLLKIIQIVMPSKLDINIKGKNENGELLLNWSKPINIKDECLEYQVYSKDSKSDSWQDLIVVKNRREYKISSIDPEVKYAYKVRARYTDICADPGTLWSEWSQEAEFGEEIQKNSIIYVIVLIVAPIIVAVAAITLLAYLKRLRILILPPVPDPRTFFKGMLGDQSGDLTNWIKPHKENPIYVPKMEETHDIISVEEPDIILLTPEKEEENETIACTVTGTKESWADEDYGPCTI